MAQIKRFFFSKLDFPQKVSPDTSKALVAPCLKAFVKNPIKFLLKSENDYKSWTKRTFSIKFRKYFQILNFSEKFWSSNFFPWTIWIKFWRPWQFFVPETQKFLCWKSENKTIIFSSEHFFLKILLWTRRKQFRQTWRKLLPKTRFSFAQILEITMELFFLFSTMNFTQESSPDT